MHKELKLFKGGINSDIRFRKSEKKIKCFANKKTEDVIFKNISEEQYRLINMDYLKNMVLGLRYQNGVDIDPDNMTYEELLQLEEKMGTVSKGLTEEQIEKLPKTICK
jgi:hypothetical protein